MILAAGIDDPFHRGLGHTGNGFFNARRANLARAGVDQDYTILGKDKGLVVVEAVIVVSTVINFADNGVHMLVDLGHVERCVGGMYAEACEHGGGNEQGFVHG